jgi:hypothetical protein
VSISSPKTSIVQPEILPSTSKTDMVISSPRKSHYNPLPTETFRPRRIEKLGEYLTEDVPGDGDCFFW